ncbi:mitochondrial antiviral-signaling protein [Denticeps clupeoides]|uniref:mitochondrial antiviral-signaling protein n=1 Tax=Denticeps clupeoides TaxID=299321 RepID=UPI0010A59ACC|nr:mitochondrial antiviral-signaling protein [Denticeps clupeoides]XP_028834763.1 mitochondrial antiviral-signaling protein [Denticeps clupeoides]
MPYASDKLYNDFVRPRMSELASKVKVREILPHLPCLTQSDREEVEAKREMTGNYNAMQLLLDCLRRRERWPEQFIKALEECEQDTLAQLMYESYNTLTGHTNPLPPAAAPAAAIATTATVTMAHVHPPPQVVHLPPQNEPLPNVVTQPNVTPSAPAVTVQSIADQYSLLPSTPPKTCQPPIMIVTQDENPPSGASQVLSLSHRNSEPIASPPAKAPVQETREPQEPVETSDPTVQQVNTIQQPASATNTTQVVQAQLPTPNSQVMAPVLSVPVPNGAGVEEEGLFSKPGVLRSVMEGPAQDPAEGDTCSVTTEDLEIDTPSSSPTAESIPTHSSKEANFVSSKVTPAARSSPAPYLLEDTAHSLNDHQSDDHDSDSLEDQSILENVGHVSEQPSVQNLGIPMAKRSRNTVHGPSKNHTQQETGLSELQPVSNCSTTPSMAEKEVLSGWGSELNTSAEKRHMAEQRESEPHDKKNEQDRRDVSPVGLIPAIRNDHLILAVVIGLSAVLLAWKLRG